MLFLLLQACNLLFVPSSHPGLRVSGRHYSRDNATYFDWSCTTLQFCFRGSRLFWLVDDSFNKFKVIIDGVQMIIYPGSQKKLLIYNGSEGDHSVEIVKQTQNHFGPLGSNKDTAFFGIEIQGQYPAIKLDNRTKKLSFEVLGDSVSTAFGALDSKFPHCFINMRDSQSCSTSWAALLAQRLDADYRVVAMSGKGVIENAFGVVGEKMPQLFTRITSNSASYSYSYEDGFMPDIVFYYIGANDYSNIVGPAASAFQAGYLRMLEETARQILLKKEGPLHLINICDANFKEKLCRRVEEAVRRFKLAHEDTHYLQIPKGIFAKQDFGCIGHPSFDGHRKIAEVVHSFVTNLL